MDSVWWTLLWIDGISIPGHQCPCLLFGCSLELVFDALLLPSLPNDWKKKNLWHMFILYLCKYHDFIFLKCIFFWSTWGGNLSSRSLLGTEGARVAVVAGERLRDTGGAAQVSQVLAFTLNETGEPLSLLVKWRFLFLLWITVKILIHIFLLTC